MRHYYTTELTFTTAGEDENPYADGTVGSLRSEHSGVIEAWGWVQFQIRKVKQPLYVEIRHHMESEYDKSSVVVWKRKFK